MYQDTISKVMVKLDTNDIKVTMRNMSGIGGSAYAAHEAFEVLIKDQIQRLEAPVRWHWSTAARLSTCTRTHDVCGLVGGGVDWTRVLRWCCWISASIGTVGWLCPSPPAVAGVHRAGPAGTVPLSGGRGEG